MPKEKGDLNKAEMCAKFLMIQLIEAEAEEFTINIKGINYGGKEFGDFEVIVRKKKTDI